MLELGLLLDDLPLPLPFLLAIHGTACRMPSLVPLFAQSAMVVLAAGSRHVPHFLHSPLFLASRLLYTHEGDSFVEHV
jgi:hypothetical protein